MKYNKYKNVWNKDLNQLDRKVNEFISIGCKPIGGVSVVVSNSNVIYNQTIIVESDSNDALGKVFTEPAWTEEVLRLYADRETALAARDLLIEKTGMSNDEAMQWFKDRW
jgi:hypothetical protein